MANARLPIVLHLTPEEIARRYRACRDGVEKTHWQVLWLLTRPGQPLSPAQAPPQASRSARPRPPRRWASRRSGAAPCSSAGTPTGRPAWPTAARPPTAAGASSPPSSTSTSGPPSASRRPTPGSGPGPRSPPMSATAGACGSASRPAGNGCAAWASRPRCRARVIRRPPRPPPGGRGKDALGARLAELRRQHPRQAVELWADDGARLGLKPITRRVWAVRGHRPPSYGRTRYQWTYVYGFVHPASGRNLELLLPAANTDWMGL